MPRKTFSLFISLTLLAFLIYFTLSIEFFREWGLRRPPVSRIMELLALLIVVYEMINSSRRTLNIGFILIPVAIVGLLFTIQHWPGARLLLLVPFFLLLTFLLIDAAKSTVNRLERILVLVVPLSWLIFMTLSSFHIPPFWMPVHLFLTTVIAVVLLYRIAKGKVINE